jgi:tryptophan synthase beta chain
MNDKTKYLLDEADLPKAWYNINADMPVSPGPVLHPVTKEPATPDFLSVLFPMKFILEAVSTERFIEIPEPVREVYKLYRPSPLIRARRLEKALDTPAHIYYKYEGGSPVGSHKPNTSIVQAFYAAEEGLTGLTTETGAGQWGSALAMACKFFDIACDVYMVKVSYNQKPYRRVMMQTFGAEVTPSPSTKTEFGSRILEADPESLGSLGIAISEAVEMAVASEGKYKYSLGSVLGPVLMHQTVVGLEALKQFEMADEYPDIIIGCVGGGSNFAGLAFPFTLTKGSYTFDYGDSARMAPVVKMHTLGHSFVPSGIHAGGLRYHGMAPHICALYDHGDLEAKAVNQLPTFEAAVQFAQTEGIIPAPETAHAVKVAIDEAIKCREEGTSKVIAFNFSGHGFLDLAAYDAYIQGELQNYAYPEEKIKEAMKDLPEGIEVPVA